MSKTRRGVQMPGCRGITSGHSSFWAVAEPLDFPFPDGGGYPKRFLPWAYRALEALGADPVDADTVLHLCSGSVRTGITVDIRPEMKPTIVADARHVPLPDASAKVILIDPPYSEEYGKNLYGLDDYPTPGSLLTEATRLLVPGGYVGFMHFQVPHPGVTRLKLRRVFGITVGAGYAIRAWSVWQKAEEGIW